MERKGKKRREWLCAYAMIERMTTVGKATVLARYRFNYRVRLPGKHEVKRFEFFLFFWLLTLLLDTHHKERRLLSLFITIHQSWHCCGFHIHKGLGFLSFPPMRIYIEGWRVSARNSPLSEVQLTGLWTNFRTDKGKGRERGKCGRLKANNEGN